MLKINTEDTTTMLEVCLKLKILNECNKFVAT